MNGSSNGFDRASLDQAGLRAALAIIHRDRLWWRKVLIGGALTLTIVGYPWVAGYEMMSLENTRKGFPTPLPPWHDWSTRYLIGLFAVLIDFIFFVLPVFAAGVLFFCASIATLAVGSGRFDWLAPLSAVLLLIYQLAMFASSVSPAGRLIYVDAGRVEDAMGARSLRTALHPVNRRVFARARLQSLPAYLPAVVLALACRWSFVPAWPAGVALLWLAFSALFYAHLVVVQLYAAAERELRFGQ
jgi:hypothetical protein